jgi:hypothetical protein
MAAFPPEVQELAESLAELKVSAALGAMTNINLMIVNFLSRKDVITREDVFQRLNEIETIVARTQKDSPTTSEYTLRMTMSLRHALEHNPLRRPS